MLTLKRENENLKRRMNNLEKDDNFLIGQQQILLDVLKSIIEECLNHKVSAMKLLV